jgi:ribonuclease Z
MGLRRTGGILGAVTIPAREERITAVHAGLPISGVSVAGRETYFVLPTLGLAFDLGRAPTALVSVANVFLSHAHLDHAAGLSYWCSQRRLLRLPGGVVRTHPSAVESWRRIVALHEELEGVRYDARVEPMEPGEVVSLRKDLHVTAFSVDHRVPTLGFLASEVRHRLRPEWQGKEPAAIRAAATSGVVVHEPVAIPLVAYSGDTARGFFDLAPPEVFRAKVLLLECSFLEERDRARSREWKHLHLDEIAENAGRFENEVVVLTHLTLRTSPAEIRREIARTLPPGLAARTVAFLPH